MSYDPASINEYTFSSKAAKDQLLLDTNVWLLVYGPQKPDAADARVPLYSYALKRILSAGSSIYIDVLIVSELINGIARRRCSFGGHGSLRDFMKSQQFIPVAQEISNIVKRVLGHCNRLDDPFADMVIDELMDEYALGKADFNDQVLRDLCKKQGLTLLTDDSGFREAGIPVLTGNGELLRSGR